MPPWLPLLSPSPQPATKNNVFSVEGREKALRLADRYGVDIDYETADIDQLEQVEAEIHEGQYHTRLGSVVCLVAAR